MMNLENLLEKGISAAEGAFVIKVSDEVVGPNA
jgi:hypothetical protein